MSREYALQPFHSAVHLQIDYARELNEQQLAAVTAPPGPALVIAGAGSGKTRTLTYRVAYLLEQGIPPERILLLTFTNKAAKEMMRRVADLLGQEPATLWGGTFHAIGNRILRQHAPLLGWQRDFSILDREDALDLLKVCVGEAGIDAKATRFPKVDALAEVFSLSANTCQPIPALLTRQFPWFEPLAGTLADLQRRYAERKRANNSMDFDDLLAQWLRLLQEHADVREHYQRRFQFILVDEYQDTNHLQGDLIDLLAARHRNVMVVGDDAQSIYAWRGANFENILKFPQRYPAARIYKIETNYRSTPEILQVANAAIKANVRQHPKQLAPARKGGGRPALVACHDGYQQAAFVAQRVLELHEEGTGLDHMAVLYRSHFHALELQLELRKRNIPFTITSGIGFFEQAHIKDVIAFLRLVSNPRDELAFQRLVRMLPGVGPKAADKLWREFSAQLPAVAHAPNTTPSEAGQGPVQEGEKPSTPTAPNAEPLDAIQPVATAGTDPDWSVEDEPLAAAVNESAPFPPGALAAALKASAKAVPKKAAKDWPQFAETLAQLERPPVRQQPAEMIRLVLEAGYEEYLQESYDNYQRRLDDLEQLAVFARQFHGLAECLTQLALLTNVEAEDRQAAARDTEQLRLSTIHQAKGLEFDVVFVIMLCDGLFPNARAMDTEEGEEEERRLFYVAVTRARNELYLSFPLLRAGYGDSGDMMQIPSRFLKEIPTNLVEEWDLKPAAFYG